MKLWTWLEIKTKVKNDLDLNAEIFVSDEELLGYGNAALDEAEQEVLKLYEKYFETDASFPVVDGVQSYDLPANIYAAKVTLLQYDDGSNKYTIDRVKDLKKIAYINENSPYQYRIVNDETDGLQVKFYPTIRETSADNITIYYLRNAKEIVDDTSIIDIPEAAQFIIQHVKDAVMNKEAGPMYSAPPTQALEKQRQNLIEILSDMHPDEDNKIEPDTSFYDDFDTDLYTGSF